MISFIYDNEVTKNVTHVHVWGYKLRQ